MNARTLMRNGALGCLTLAVFAQLTADLHGFVAVLGTLPHFDSRAIVATVYTIIGLAAEPILILSILLLALGFLGAWRETGIRWARRASIAAFAYLVTRVFWAWADLNFAFALRQNPGPEKMTLPGALLGIAALAAGITAGIGLASMMLAYFRQSGSVLGFRACILVIVCMVVGMLTKTLSMWYAPITLTVAFLLCMGGKSVGLGIVAHVLFEQSQAGRVVEAKAAAR
jgi:hypothetical protein